MKTYSVKYYLMDMLHSVLIDAENESDCILKVIKSLPNPKIMHDFKIKIYSKGNDAVVSAKQVYKLEERIKELDFELTKICRDLGICKFEKYNLEQRNEELAQKNEELETELQQYKAFVDDITYAIQNAVYEEFCPNFDSCVTKAGD